jgi:hypothetical protein
LFGNQKKNKMDIANFILLCVLLYLTYADNKIINEGVTNLYHASKQANEDSLRYINDLRNDMVGMFYKIPLADEMEKEIRSMCNADCTTDEILDYLDGLKLPMRSED